MGVPPVESLRAWHPAVEGVVEAFEATFIDHAYPPHTHAAWTLFVVDHGGVVYDVDRRPRTAPAHAASLLPPHVVHDGRPALPDGYRMRVMYLEPHLLPASLVGPSIDRPVLRGSTIAPAVVGLHAALDHLEDAFEAEVRLHDVLDAIVADLGPDVRARDAGSAQAADEVRAYLDAHVGGRPRMAEIASALGASPGHLARVFRDAYGITPHAYHEGLVLEAARDRLLRGQPLADVAVELGFADQAHFTRRFRRFLGTTPGRFTHSFRDRALAWPASS